MAMNRVRFQPGLSMHQFMDLLGTQEKCETVVISWRWPTGWLTRRIISASDHAAFATK